MPDREMGDHGRVTALMGTQLAEVKGYLRHPPVAQQPCGQAELRRALAKSWTSALPRVLHTGNGSFRHGGFLLLQAVAILNGGFLNLF